MTEEVKTEVVEAPQPSEAEVAAIAHGWRPKEEFDADERNQGKKWRSAEEFMDRKSLYDKIDDQHKKIRNLEKGLESLAIHNKRIEETSYKKALQELKSQRKLALADGDVVKAEEINDEIDELREKQVTAPPALPPVRGEPPQLTAWKSRNTWYGADGDLTVFADGVGNKLLQEGKSPDEIFTEVEKRVKSAFPHKFRNPNKELAPDVGTGSRKVKGDSFTLSSDEERIMNNLLRSGAPITKEEYIQQIKKSRGV
jgi:hypothetical protein